MRRFVNGCAVGAIGAAAGVYMGLPFPITCVLAGMCVLRYVVPD